MVQERKFGGLQKFKGDKKRRSGVRGGRKKLEKEALPKRNRLEPFGGENSH